MLQRVPGKTIPARSIRWRDWDDPVHGDLPGVRWAPIFSERQAPGMGLVEIAPRAEIPKHHHAPVEVYHVIAGEGFVTVGRRRSRLRPGTPVYIPSNAMHRTVNTGGETLRILYSFPAAAFSEVDYHLD